MSTTETIDHAELRQRIRDLEDRIDAEKPDSDLFRDAAAVLNEAANALYAYTLATGEADAGETAEPEPEHALAPRPTPDGPWLLIMHDENASGGMWMRRYAKKEDAMCVSANATGPRQTWLFEVVREHDINEATREFWAHVEIA